MLRLAELYLEKGDIQRAVNNANGILALEPGSAEVQEIVGRVREKVGDLEAAKEAYRKAFELSPLRFESLYRLALLLSRSEDAAEQAEGAILVERYERVLPFLPDLQLIEAERNLNPRNVRSLVTLAAVLNKCQEYRTAATKIAEAMQNLPGDPQALAIAGCIAANTGENARALEYFRDAQQRVRAPDETIQSYIDALEKGEPLPLPLGSLTRPTTEESAESVKKSGDSGGE